MNDPDYGFAILVTAELTAEASITNAYFKTPAPDNATNGMDDFLDSWDYFDSPYASLSELNTYYPNGTYTLYFHTVHDGVKTCPLSLPNTPLPPTPRITNYTAAQSVPAGQPFTLGLEITGGRSTDLVTCYIQEGHATLFITPSLGESNALNGLSQTVLLPANTLAPGMIYEGVVEIDRFTATNTTSYSGIAGYTGVFKSTSFSIRTRSTPQLSVQRAPGANQMTVATRSPGGRTIVLQGATNLGQWFDIWTNADAVGSHQLSLPLDACSRYFLRAVLP